MKKILLLSLCSFLLFAKSKATVHIVQASNFQFTPANIPNVVVGDVIRWVWVEGSHTTSCDPFNFPGTQAPNGAASWNGDLTASSPTFEYTVTVPGDYIYFCAPHFPNMGGSFTASNVVPLKLTWFLINDVDNTPSLVWKTMNEVNTDHFNIRRSLNGKDFEAIANVKAAGNSNSERTYSFVDKNISKNAKFYYYNISSVDRDGKTVYSEVRMFKNKHAENKLILTLSPNPVTKEGHLNLTFNSEKEGKMMVKVVNQEGKIIITRNMQAYPGVNSGHVHLGERPAGTYTVICTLDETTETHRIVVQ